MQKANTRKEWHKRKWSEDKNKNNNTNKNKQKMRRSGNLTDWWMKISKVCAFKPKSRKKNNGAWIGEECKRFISTENFPLLAERHTHTHTGRSGAWCSRDADMVQVDGLSHFAFRISNFTTGFTQISMISRSLACSHFCSTHGLSISPTSDSIFIKYTDYQRSTCRKSLFNRTFRHSRNILSANERVWPLKRHSSRHQPHHSHFLMPHFHSLRNSWLVCGFFSLSLALLFRICCLLFAIEYNMHRMIYPHTQTHTRRSIWIYI